MVGIPLSKELTYFNIPTSRKSFSETSIDNFVFGNQLLLRLFTNQVAYVGSRFAQLIGQVFIGKKKDLLS